MKEIVLLIQLFFLIIVFSFSIYNLFYLVQTRRVEMKLGITIPGVVKNMVAFNMFFPIAIMAALLFFIFLTLGS